MPLRAAAWCLSTTALAACAPAPAPAHAQAPAAAPADTARPLAEFASRPLALVPVQLLGSGDSLGFAAQVNNAGAFLASIDDEIAFALSQRRTARQWQMPPVLARRMRSNGPYGVDVHDMGAGPLRDPKLKGDLPLPDPLASNLRSLVALGGEARYVLIPVEVTFAGAKGAGRAVLKLVLVDARSARLVWVGVVATDPVARVTPAIPAMLGARVADLVTAP
ncbi:MAG: hypothetical protein HYX65_06020 [Gemmatimonadetes bacterium]|nr:hypothetical protein [Gemmatimonadota bacterium]